MTGVCHHTWSLVPATWTVQLSVCSCHLTTVPPDLPETSVWTSPLSQTSGLLSSWVALVMQEQTRMLQPGLEALLPALLFSVSLTPKLPSTQVLASPVPLQSHICSSHALVGTFLSLPIAPHKQRLPASPPLFVLGPLSALLSCSAPPI